MDFLLKLVFGMTVLATIAAVNEGDGDLVKMFAKERKEMRADFRRENDEQNRFIAELHQGLAEQKKENADQKKQNDEQNRVIAEQKEEMKRLHKRLHRADLQNKEAHRQRDEKQSQERHSSELEDVVESVVKRSIRHSGKNNTNSSLEIELKKLIDQQIDHYLIEIELKKLIDHQIDHYLIEIELKKLIDQQIDHYLINQRICVAGKYSKGAKGQRQTVNFGYEFPRTPTVSASFARVFNNKGAQLFLEVVVRSVTRSTAIIDSYAYYGPNTALDVSWLACL